ncbi:MAG: CBS domain-containing protein [Candidatus Dormibacter sp.]
MDFAPGKQAWYEENEPREGKAAEETWIGDVMDADVPTCRLTDRIGDVRERVRTDGHDICVVVNDQRIVLGLLRKDALEADDSVTAEAVMHVGPSTFRPNLSLEEMLKFQREHNIKTVSLITTPKGRLLGTIARNDLEATLAHDASP